MKSQKALKLVREAVGRHIKQHLAFDANVHDKGIYQSDDTARASTARRELLAALDTLAALVEGRGESNA